MIHFYWCGFCGAKLAFTESEVEQPQWQEFVGCPRCQEHDWRPAGELDLRASE